MKKDCWDKTEIVAKAAGAVLIPLAVAASVLFYNIGASQRATAAQMMNIAVGILMSGPLEDGPTDDALRNWAIEVLAEPSRIVPLGREAAAELRMRKLFQLDLSNLMSDKDLTTMFEGKSMLGPDK